MAPYAEGVYSNYLDRDEDDRTGAAYGENYERLADIEAESDNKPGALFRRAALASVLGVDGLIVGLCSPARAQQGGAGRHLQRNQGTLDFTGTAEWGNPGYTNSASGSAAIVSGGQDNDAAGNAATVGGGSTGVRLSF
jgi:hypothetical protein